MTDQSLGIGTTLCGRDHIEAVCEHNGSGPWKWETHQVALLKSYSRDPKNHDIQRRDRILRSFSARESGKKKNPEELVQKNPSKRVSIPSALKLLPINNCPELILNFVIYFENVRHILAGQMLFVIFLNKYNFWIFCGIVSVEHFFCIARDEGVDGRTAGSSQSKPWAQGLHVMAFAFFSWGGCPSLAAWPLDLLQSGEPCSAHLSKNFMLLLQLCDSLTSNPCTAFLL